MTEARLDNIGIAVSDVEVSIDFYRKFPGVRIDSHLDLEPRAAQVWFAETYVYLFEVSDTPAESASAGPRPGLDHLSLRVPDVRRAVEEYSAGGINFDGPPHDEADWGLTMVMTTDPDGVQIYLISDLEPAANV